jgi:DNA-binding CsgD family transcriptional regulator
MLTRPDARPTVAELRRRIIDANVGSAPPAMLDCAAHMLLYADDLDAVKRIGLRHLLERFEATRIDLGFATPHSNIYVATAFERRADCQVPNPEGIKLPNRDRGIQVVWQSDQTVYLDIGRDPLLARMRHVIRDTFRTKAKMAHRLEYEGNLFGLVCVDHTEETRRWDDRDQAYLNQYVLAFLSPILFESRAIRSARESAGLLTETEKAVVRLAALGLTYKEIARQLGKSPNTVDNQLRRIRAKLGVHNQVELVRASNGLV